MWNYYGICLVGLGYALLLPIIIINNTFGPISDNV